MLPQKNTIKTKKGNLCSIVAHLKNCRTPPHQVQDLPSARACLSASTLTLSGARIQTLMSDVSRIGRWCRKLFPGICNGCRHLWHSGGDWLFSSVHTRWCLDHSCSTLCWCRLSFWVRIRHKIRRHCAISLKIRKKKQMNERLDCCNCLINALAFLNYLTKWWKVPLCLVCFAFAFLCFETCEGGFHRFCLVITSQQTVQNW